MLARLPRGRGLSVRKACVLLPKLSRGMALKNPQRPPKQKRSPQPIFGTNKWTVDDRLSRSNKCDPYEQGGKPLPGEEARMLLARGMVQALSTSGLAPRPRPADLTRGLRDLADLPQWELVQCINTQYLGITRSWQLDGILEAVRSQFPCTTETIELVGTLPKRQANLRAGVRLRRCRLCTQAGYMTKIADLALMDAHFPDLHVWDGSVLQVELTTPQLKGLSYADFVLAVKIDVTIDALREAKLNAG